MDSSYLAGCFIAEIQSSALDFLSVYTYSLGGLIWSKTFKCYLYANDFWICKFVQDSFSTTNLAFPLSHSEVTDLHKAQLISSSLIFPQSSPSEKRKLHPQCFWAKSLRSSLFPPFPLTCHIQPISDSVDSKFTIYKQYNPYFLHTTTLAQRTTHLVWINKTVTSLVSLLPKCPHEAIINTGMRVIC